MKAGFFMKLGYTDILNQYLRNIGKAGSTETNITADFNLNVNWAYQLIFAKLSNYITQEPKTASTVASQQYYYYPPGVVNIEDIVITIGSVNYPLEAINSQRQWDILNAIQIQPTVIPQFFFPRKDDFGIWPIPSDAYTITFNYHLRDRNLSIEDKTAGTVDVVNGDATIAGTSTAFAGNEAGLWFSVTTNTNDGYGYWYRIASYTSATALELEQNWQGTSGSTLSYKIIQSPELPEEAHILLADGATMRFYAGLRDDQDNAKGWSNVFWTGDWGNPLRDESNPNIKSGLIGLMKDYADRNRSVLVRRNPTLSPIGQRTFSYSITQSY